MFDRTDTYTATLIDGGYMENGGTKGDVYEIILLSSFGDMVREALDSACENGGNLVSIKDSSGNVVYGNSDAQFAAFEEWDCEAPIREVSATEAFDTKANWTIDTNEGSYKLYGTLGWVIGILIDEERKVNAITGARYTFTGTEEEIDAWREWDFHADIA